VSGVPDFATYSDGVLKVKTDDEKLAGGYRVEIYALCTEGTAPVDSTINFPINILTGVEEV